MQYEYTVVHIPSMFLLVREQMRFSYLICARIHTPLGSLTGNIPRTYSDRNTHKYSDGNTWNVFPSEYLWARIPITVNVPINVHPSKWMMYSLFTVNSGFAVNTSFIAIGGTVCYKPNTPNLRRPQLRLGVQVLQTKCPLSETSSSQIGSTSVVNQIPPIWDVLNSDWVYTGVANQIPQSETFSTQIGVQVLQTKYPPIWDVLNSDWGYNRCCKPNTLCIALLWTKEH